MSNPDNNSRAGDAQVDAVAAVMLITIVIVAAVFWLSSF
ncbi:MAG: methionine synthase [Porticoccaceae bacterium]